MGDTFAVDLLFENEPYDCPGRTRQPYPPAPDCGEEEGGEGGECPDAVTMVTTSNCTNLDSSDKTNSNNDDCGYYNWYPDDCSSFDDDDFLASVLCCACTGGQPVVASAAAKDDGAVGLAVGVSVAVVAIIAGVLATLYVRDKRNRDRLANLPFEFDPMIQELREIGLLGNRSNSISNSTSVGVVEPVELTRHKVTMFEKIGAGQFGAVILTPA